MKQVLELGEVLRLFRSVGGQISRMPDSPCALVMLTSEAGSRAGQNIVDLAKRETPEQLVRLAGIDP